jgi:ABC-type antimicrobial peptide transport system permease subunit
VVLRMTVDLSVLLSAGILTFFMGAVGGFIPSVSAMRLKPLESLR